LSDTTRDAAGGAVDGGRGGGGDRGREPRARRTNGAWRFWAAAPLLCGLGLGLGLAFGHGGLAVGNHGTARLAPALLSSSFGLGAALAADDAPRLAAFASDDLGGDPGSSDYLFLVNRRTIWAINRVEGRFAGYHFRDDEARTVERTQIVSLDQRDFPPADTVYLMSDRNLTEVVWVCNRKTGDIRMFAPRLGGQVVGEKPITTQEDLRRK